MAVLTSHAADIRGIFEAQSVSKHSVGLSTAAERIAKLNALLKQVERRTSEIEDALYRDFRKPAPEVLISEIYPVTSELKHTIKHLKKWTRPKRVRTPITFAGASSYIYFEPRGVCLVISPWNYPFQLALLPLISAIAAGNCVILKPSEYSFHTSSLLKSILESVFDRSEVAVFEGDYRVAKSLLELPFDHIFFTGSPEKGKLIMAAAAEHLSSVTLELGGKSPAIIDVHADLEEAAERIAWGKFINAGQTCVAPDYVMVHSSEKHKFLANLVRSIEKLYGPEEKLAAEGDYSRIINSRHHKRLRELYEDAKRNGASVVYGGETDTKSNYFSPTILSDVSLHSPIMQEEIFGPILPVLTYESLEESIYLVRSLPKPLALYIFSKDKRRAEYIIKYTTAGSTVVNDVAVQYGNLNLPFGGVNSSGIGSSHGHFGFKAFSHERAVMKQPKYAMIKMLYPPYTSKVRKMIDMTIKYF